MGASRAVSLLACALFFALPAAVLATPITQTAGPFSITFYNQGDQEYRRGPRGAKDWTQAEIDDVVASVATWANRLTNVPGRPVVLHMLWYAWQDNTLGATSAPTNGDGTTSWTYVEHAWRDGVDYQGPWTRSDCTVQFDTNAAGTSWNIGTGTPTSGQIDFRSVVTHEIGHALGFYPSYASNDYWGACWGTSSSPNTFAGYLGLSNWDKFLVDNTGNHPAPNATGTPGDFNQVANPVYFTGPHAVAYYGGNVPVYAPNPYEGGSSLSHLNEATFPNALMSPFVGMGQAVRGPTRLEWEIMKDLGWDVVTTLHWTHGAGTLNWTDAANWDNPGAPPDATWDVVLTSAGLADGSTIALGGSASVNVLTIDSTAGFTLGGASGTLTIVKGNLTRTAASAGSQAIARPVALGASAVWDIAGSGQLAIAGGLSGSGFGLTKQGDGTLVFSGACAYTGPTAVQGGTLVLAGGSSASSGCTVAAGATLLASAPSLALAGTLSNSGTVRVQGGTLSVPGSVAQLVGTTLTGGTWEVDADSSLDLVAGSPIATNKATVVLDGPNSLFAKFDSVLASDGSLTIRNGRTFTTAADFSNGGQVLVGAGSLLAVAGTYTQTAGRTSIDGQLTAASGWASILGGVLELNADVGAGGAVLSLDVIDSSATFGADQHLDTLSVGEGGRVAFADAVGVVLKHLANAGTIDVTTGDLIVDYDGPSPLAAIQAMLASGCAGGTWDGPGVLSSTAASYPDELTAVGVLDNADPEIGGRTIFEGEPVDEMAVLVKYTWWGDANLDGVVDANDYDVIDPNFLVPPAPENTGWWTGDFNYDGVVDANDYDRIDRSLLFQTGPLAAGDVAAPAATPEPATLALVALGGLGLALRRRKA